MKKYLATLKHGLSDVQEKKLSDIAKRIEARLKKDEKVSKTVIGELTKQLDEMNDLSSTHHITTSSDMSEFQNKVVKRVCNAFNKAVFAPGLLTRNVKVGSEDTATRSDLFSPKTPGPSAEEQVARTETIAFLRNRYKAQIARIDKDLDQPPLTLTKDKKVELRAKKALFQKKSDNLDKFAKEYSAKTWVGSNDFRDMAKRYSLDVGEMSSVAALVNARMHTIKTTNTDGNESTRTIHRSGAIADFSDGTRLLDLEKRLKIVEKQLKDPALDKANLKAEKAFLKAEIASRKKGTYLLGLKNKLENYQKILIGIPPEIETFQDGKPTPQGQALKALCEIRNKTTPDDKPTLEAKALINLLRKETPKLKAEIAERHSLLEDQFLQMLTTHYTEIMRKAVAEGKPLSPNFIMSQMSLLAQQNIKMMPAFIQNEGYFMVDMHTMFREFRNKIIKIDGEPGSGTCIDHKGIIHLAQPKGLQVPEDGIKLMPIFFNVSVQQGTKDDLAQKKYNNLAFQDLIALTKHLDKVTKRKLLTEINDLRAKLKKDGGSLEIAAEIMNLTKKIIEKVNADHGEGMNCFSGKDRTGELAKRLARDEYAASFPDEDRENARLLEMYSDTIPDNAPEREALIANFKANFSNRATLREHFSESITAAQQQKQEQLLAQRMINIEEHLKKNDFVELGELYSELLPPSPDKDEVVENFDKLLGEYGRYQFGTESEEAIGTEELEEEEEIGTEELEEEEEIDIEESEEEEAGADEISSREKILTLFTPLLKAQIQAAAQAEQAAAQAGIDQFNTITMTRDERLTASYEALPENVKGDISDVIFRANIEDKPMLRAYYADAINAMKNEKMQVLDGFFKDPATASALIESFKGTILDTENKEKLVKQLEKLLKEGAAPVNEDAERGLDQVQNKIRKLFSSRVEQVAKSLIHQFNINTRTKSEIKKYIEDFEKHLGRDDGIARTIAGENIGTHRIKLQRTVEELGVSKAKRAWEARPKWLGGETVEA